MAWLDAAGVKLLIGYGGTDKDAQITALIPAGTGLIEAAIGRKIEMASYVELQDGRGAQHVLAKNRPIYKVTSLKDALDRNFANATAFAVNSYAVSRLSGRITIDSGSADAFISGLSGGVFSSGYQNVEVRYQAGYSDDAVTYPAYTDAAGVDWPAASPIPTELKLGLALVVWAICNTALATGKKSEAIGNYRYEMADPMKGIEALSPAAATVIQSWMNHAVSA